MFTCVGFEPAPTKVTAKADLQNLTNQNTIKTSAIWSVYKGTNKYFMLNLNGYIVSVKIHNYWVNLKF